MATYNIEVPDAGKIGKYSVNDEDYDIEINKITNERISKSESPAFIEMIKFAGAIADGTIDISEEKKGKIPKLDELINFNKKLGFGKVSFYILP